MPYLEFSLAWLTVRLKLKSFGLKTFIKSFSSPKPGFHDYCLERSTSPRPAPTPLKKGTCELKERDASVVGTGTCSSLAIPETRGF